MKRPTEAQAAKIEARIEDLRYRASHAYRAEENVRLHAEADRLEAEYWIACGRPDLVAERDRRERERVAAYEARQTEGRAA